MKKIFTKMKFALIAAIGFLALETQGQAILNVEGIGTFQASLANFGVNSPCDLGVVSAPIRLANDGTANVLGCDPFIDADLNGKIGVVNRGDCGFAQKAANVEANGAVGLVICNNEPGRRPMGPTAGVNVTIPTVLVSLQDCFNLLNALDGGSELPATVEQDPVALPDVVNIVWGDQPGQGEFEGGMNGWTAENCSVDNSGTTSSPLTWQWYANPIEEFFSSQMISYSRCNGAVGYDASNWNIANGDLSNPNNYPNHHCELLSPVIDLSAAGPVSLQFWQVNFSLNGNDNPGDPVSRIFISYDGGMTWPDQINVETNNILTADQTVWANGELRRYFLPQLAGEPNVRLRFEFHGDFYAWYVDDVYFIETPDHSLTINEGVYGMQPSARTPLSLVEPILAIGEVANTGLQDQPNTIIDVEYVGPSGPENRTIELGTLQSDSVSFDCATAAAFTPTEVGNYAVTMTASSDNMDFDMSDNTLDFAFEVTDAIWSKDAGEVNGNVRPADAPNFVWGPVFSVPDDYTGTDMIYGLEFGFSLADSVDGSDQFLTWSILEWEDGNDDGTSQASERTSLESGFVLFSYRDGVDNEMTTYDLEALPDNNPIAIEAGKNYVIAVQWDNPDRDLNLFGYNGYDYLGMRVAYDDCSAFSRFNDLIGIGNDISGDWSTGGWTSGIVPAMRLITDPDAIGTSNNEITQNFTLDMYPNPVVADLNVEVEFEEVVDNLEISVTDITGRVIAVQNDQKVTSANYVFDLSRQNTGVYFAKIRTDEGIATKRFVVSQ